MKRYVVILILLMLFLSGCAAVEELLDPTETTGFGDWIVGPEEAEKEPYAENREIAYEKWIYEGNHINAERYHTDLEDRWCDPNNLTSTGDEKAGMSDMQFGALVICSWEEYQAVMDVIAGKETECTAQIGLWKDPGLAVYTLDGPIDEGFFENQHLVMIDYCRLGSTYLRTRLDQVTCLLGKANVRIQIQELISSTADKPGEVYWIPVSADCTEVEVEFESVFWENN